MTRGRYPRATFEVKDGEDSIGTYVWASVDVEDTDQVMDIVVDRLLELQVDEGTQVYFVPTRPLHLARVGGHQGGVRHRRGARMLRRVLFWSPEGELA